MKHLGVFLLICFVPIFFTIFGIAQLVDKKKSGAVWLTFGIIGIIVCLVFTLLIF